MHRGLDAAHDTTPRTRRERSVASSSMATAVSAVRGVRPWMGEEGLMDEQELIDAGYAEAEVSDWSMLHEDGTTCDG